MKTYVNDIFKMYEIEKTQLNVNAVKGLISAMINKGKCIYNKQQIVFDEKEFLEYWKIYSNSLVFFDVNYNRKTDFSLYFKYIIDCKEYLEKSINFHALFCPGYSRYGYKDYLGNTTLWKLKKLRELINELNKHIKVNLTCYYSDVFLENCDSNLEPKWKEQLEYNRSLFHEEASKYYDASMIKNMSELNTFSKFEDIEGFVDADIIKSVPYATYSAFKKSNDKFYKLLGFTEEQIEFRNDRLITMYRIFSDYLNGLDNSVFLPMENMYERENIFSENNTCTMYLKLKK